MGGDYGRGFWSVALLLRCAGLALGLAFYTVIAPQAAHGATFPIQTWTAYCVGGENDDGQQFTDCSYQRTGGTSFEVLTQECNRTVSYEYNYVCRQTDLSNGNRSFFRGWCEASHLHPVQQQNGGWACTDEPPPPPECPLSPGTTAWFDSNLATMCAQNCEWTTPPGGTLAICLGPDGADCRYTRKYTSQDQYCENPSGQPEPVPKSTFEEYTDEDGCYYDTNGQKFCNVPPDSPCPNYVVIEGNTYCRGAEPDDGEPDPLPDHDSDGDGIPDRHDDNPDNPDADGDGTPDGEQDGDGNGIPDGDPGGIADDGEGDGNEPGDGYHDGGTCEPDERLEPECSENMDPIQCALAIELFHVRCDATTEHRDFVGDEEYLEGPSITSSEDGDGDGQPDNGIPTSTLDAGTVISGLSEDTISFGNLACPADRTFSMPGAFGGSFTLSWEPICDWAAMVRPIVIALGYLMSALIILRKFSGGSD